MKRNPERPQSGLHERRGPLKLGGAPSGVVVPCSRCGADVELSSTTVELVKTLQARAKGQGEAPLQRDEIATCDRRECKDAYEVEQHRRAERERHETEAIIDAIKRGEAITVPAEIVRYRPGDHAQIKRALQARREGRLPTLDKEIE